MNKLKLNQLSSELQEAVKTLKCNEFVVLGLNHFDNSNEMKEILYLVNMSSEFIRLTLESGVISSSTKKVNYGYINEKRISENSKFGQSLYDIDENFVHQDFYLVNYLPNNLLKIKIIQSEDRAEIVNSLDDDLIISICEYTESDDGYYNELRNIHFYDDLFHQVK